MKNKSGPKKRALLIGLSAISFALFGQEITHDVSVINIEIPVRVFKGSTFVDNLTLKDFEVYEDGKLQKIEAVYLIKKASIRKEEGKKKFAPQVSRHFVLLFQISEYLPKVGDAIDYFFKNIILPGDTLTVITPMKTYTFKSKALEALPREKITEQLIGKLIKDSRLGSAEYRNIVKDLEESVIGGIDPDYYRQTLQRLEDLRYVDEKKFLEFADFLKVKEGQKHVFFFYQKEVLPQIDLSNLIQLMSLQQDDVQSTALLSDLFTFYKRDITFNVDRIKQVFADSSISVHFLFITKAPSWTGMGGMYLKPSGLRYAEKSEDIYSAFREVAQATGGLVESSANAAFSFEKAVDASENYYLIYYSPENYGKDGKFKEIKVKVKKENYRILHRTGYFAN